MPSEPSLQYYALVKLSLQMREFIAEELPALATDLFWNFFLPFIVTVVLSGVTLKLSLVLYSFIYPPTASELHKEALKILENTSRRPDNIDNISSNSRKMRAKLREIQQSEQQAEDLLQRAMKRDDPITVYEPAVLSLAALYAYRQRKPQEALRLLEPFFLASSKEKKNCTRQHLAALDAVWQDAQAMVEGHDNMVQTELAEAEYLTILATRAT